MRLFAVPPLLGALLIGLTSTIAASGVNGAYTCSSTTSCLSANQSAPSGSSGAAIKGTATNSFGVRGASTNSVGTIGQSASGSMLSPGVEGESTVSSGTADVAGGFGLLGLSGRAPAYGVFAVGATAGVFGELPASAKTPGAGVTGLDATGQYSGVVGESATSANGTLGVGVTGMLAPANSDHVGIAVYGSTGITSTPFVGTAAGLGGYFTGFGVNQAAIGFEADSNALAGVFYDPYVVQKSQNDYSGSEIMFEQAGHIVEADVFDETSFQTTAQFIVDDNANVTATGTITAKAAVVSDEAAFRQTGTSGTTMTAYGTRAAEPELEDVGEGQLAGGRAIVQIDAKLADAMDPSAAYHVFITPEGDSKGLYVARKSRTSFVVAEQQGGRSSMAFDYRIVAKPYGHNAARLAIVAPQRMERSRFMPSRKTKSTVRALSFPSPEQRTRAIVGDGAYRQLLAKHRSALMR